MGAEHFPFWSVMGDALLISFWFEGVLSFQKRGKEFGNWALCKYFGEFGRLGMTLF